MEKSSRSNPVTPFLLGVASLGLLASPLPAGVPAVGTSSVVPDPATNQDLPVAQLAWRGTTNNVWDLGISPNWFSSELAAEVAFSNGYAVAFDDTPGVLTNVVLAGGALLSPGDLVVNAATNLFSITGGGGLVGTCGITKAGSQRFVLGGASNAFSGAVTIGEGTLAVATTNALGSAARGTIVGGGGALDVNGLNLGSEPVEIAGAGPGGNGAIVNSGAAQFFALQYLTLAGDASVGGLVRWDIRPGTAPYVNLNGYTLTKTGTNQVSIVGATVTNSGSLSAQSGWLSIENASVVSGPGAIHVHPQATLQFYQSATVTKTNYLHGGTVYCGNAATIGAPFVVTTNSTFNTPNNLTITNRVDGPAGLVKMGSARLIVLGTVTNAGGIIVSNGFVQVGNYNVASGDVGVDVNAVASAQVFEIRRQGPYTWSRNLGGNGTIQMPATNGTYSFAGINRADQLLISSGATRGTNSAVVLLAGSSNVFRNVQVAYTIFSQGNYGRLEIQDGAYLRTSDLYPGNNTGGFGDVVQHGGTVIVTNGGTAGLRIGHYPNSASSHASYLVGGGTLSVPNTGIHVGWDGAGVLTQTGGVISTPGLVVDANTATAATAGQEDTVNLTGGSLYLGTNGISTASGGSYVINLGGGTLGANAAWSSSLAMNLTGSNGHVTVDTSTNAVTLAGALSGTGGLVKAGSGVLKLPASYAFSGVLAVSNGTVLLNGVLEGSGAEIAGGGTLAGTGILAGAVSNDGILAPAGTNAGVLIVINDLTQTANGLLQIHLASNANDQLLVTGTATPAGTLDVSLAGNFVPETGSVFTVLTAGSVSGVFDATNLPSLPAHRCWSVAYTATSVVLGVDFTNDAPSVAVPGPHLLALGATTNFTVTSGDPDGDATAVVNTAGPPGAVFTNGNYSWTATPADWNSTNTIVFVAADAFGRTATNATVIVVPFDADGDGLPDGWEWMHFATLTNGPDGDVAGKGASLLQEYIAGTDPTDGNSLFRAAAIAGAPALVTVPTVSGRIYRVWFTDDPLAVTPAWSLFADQSNGVGTWLETNTPPVSHTFADGYGPGTSGFPPTNGVRCYRFDVRLAP